MAPAVSQIAEEVLGPLGRMIASTKTGYGQAHPGHVAIFNANVCVAGQKAWYGDLDLTRDEVRLRVLAARVGAPIHVLFEQAARFAQESEPLLDEAIYWIEPGEEPRFDETLVCRNAEGALRWTRWKATQ
jgi:hypothetical protein